MKGGKAVEIFELAKRKGGLPVKLEDLVPLSFIGQAAVSFYRSKIKLMDQLKMTESQRKVTLKDGQDAGEMLLDIEARIGELAEKEERATTLPVRGVRQGRGMKPSGKPPKHERLGVSEKHMHQSVAIHKHPEIVERVKAQARENEDIPTRTAVIATINYESEKRSKEKAKESLGKLKGVIAIEQVQYINALDKAIRVIPIQPPKQWNEQAFKEAKAKAQIIIKRLEVFSEKS